MSAARYQEPSELAAAASEALRDLTFEQEAIARADLMQGGTASTEDLAELLRTTRAAVLADRHEARRKILRNVRGLLGDGGWSSLVVALRSTGLPDDRGGVGPEDDLAEQDLESEAGDPHDR